MSDLPLDTVEIETAPAPRAAIVWMHGLGADGHDFEPIVPELDLPSSLPVRFVFPHAPMRPVTINAGYVMRAWYDVRDDRGVRHEDEPGVRASQARIEALIARERGRGDCLRADRPGRLLPGRGHGPPHGTAPPRAAWRESWPCPASCPWPDPWRPRRARPTVTSPSSWPTAPRIRSSPLARGRGPVTLLQAIGYRMEWREYPMPHAVCPEEIRDIGAWLRAVLQD